MSTGSWPIRGLPGDETECTTEGLIGTYGMLHHEALPFSPYYFTIMFGGISPMNTGDGRQEIVLRCQDRDIQFGKLTEDSVLGFDHIIFTGPDEGMTTSGSVGVGIAVLKLHQTVPDTDTEKYQWIGSINYERRAKNQGYLFEGLDDSQTNPPVDASGHWVVEKICLT